MNMTRKFASLLLAMILVLCAVTPAMADQGVNNDSGKVTIENAVVGQTYTIYQLLVLESYNTESKAYSYKATEKWKDFIASAAIQKVYLNTDEDGYVTWVDKADPAEFAKLAQKYAKDHNIGNQGSKEATTTTVEFTGLNLGYYLVDSTLGILCSLDTTEPSVTIKEKNAAPTNEKTVEEDSTNKYGATNDADIGQTVNFKSTITAQAGAENYVFHDKMPAGLTYGSVTGITLNDVAVDTKYYTVKTADLTDGCTFEVVFTQEFCDTLKADDKIVISYTATVNENAVVGLPGNPNSSQLSYGDSSNTTSGSNVTPPSETITYTWDLDVLKYGNSDKSNVLAGAQFVLLNSDKSKVAVIETGKLTKWETVPAAVDGVITWPANTLLTTNAQGKIEIDGLDADTYYLLETKAPDGYNKLSKEVEVVIKGATKAEGSDTLTYTTVVAEVNNQSGTELPSTGGMGTTLFYVVGGVLVVAAFVLLVTKRRVGAEK